MGMPKTVTVSLFDLGQATVPFSSLESAFGPDSLGILVVKDLPQKYHSLREKALGYASYLANLSAEELDDITDAASHYEIGWSHGKEKLASGRYDTLKGSYYLNCQDFYLASGDKGHARGSAHVHSAPNLWPRENLLPGFRSTIEEFCSLIIDIGALVARSCDRYATRYVDGYKTGYLEHMVRTSATTKARLLHYFPPSRQEVQQSQEAIGSRSTSPEPVSAPGRSSDSTENDNNASWCATHLDDGCLTALCSAIYVEESLPLPPSTSPSFPSLASTSTAPDREAGLYIRSRTDTVVKVDIPRDCLAFQTGEALQLITGGKFKAVPHFVRGSKAAPMQVARNTLAIFMQPNVNEVIDQATGMTFGEFADISIEKHA